jgi:hypothetical protein
MVAMDFFFVAFLISFDLFTMAFAAAAHAGRLRLRRLAAGGRENEIQPRLVLHQQIDQFSILQLVQSEVQRSVYPVPRA